jgi:hypothetical protein
LEVDGAKKFKDPFGKLMESVDKKRVQALALTVDEATLELGQYQAAVDAQLQAFNSQQFTEGFWQKKADLWVADEAGQQSIRSFMGWLRVAETMVGAVPAIEQFVNEVRAAGFQHVVVMGMGGSTMAPIVFTSAFPRGENGLPTTVLDTTDPGTVRRVEAAVPLAETLFIVASKSGTTAEPLAFGDYFYAKLKELKGDRAGENFVAITDPGSQFVAFGYGAGLPPHFPELRRGGRALLGPHLLRAGTRGALRPCPSASCSDRGRAHDAGLRRLRPRGDLTRSWCWARPGRARPARPRQADASGARGPARPGPVAGAAAGRKHGQGRARAFCRWPGAAGRARPLRHRPGVCVRGLPGPG